MPSTGYFAFLAFASSDAVAFTPAAAAEEPESKASLFLCHYHPTDPVRKTAAASSSRALTRASEQQYSSTPDIYKILNISVRRDCLACLDFGRALLRARLGARCVFPFDGMDRGYYLTVCITFDKATRYNQALCAVPS